MATKKKTGKEAEKPLKKEDELKEIAKLEENIAKITIEISDFEKQLEASEKEASSLIREWIQIPPKTDAEKEARRNRIAAINEREEQLVSDYIEWRKKKDDFMFQLRNHYMNVIKLWHGDNKNNKGPADINKSVPLEKSSVLSGTSVGGMDNTDYSKLFKTFELPTKFNDDLFPVNKDKRYSFDVKDVSVARFGKLHGKEVFVKEYKLETALCDKIYASYKDAKELMGHRSLLSVIGSITSEKGQQGPLRIALELAGLPDDPRPPSLGHILFPKATRLNFSFGKKLDIAKSICDAMAWLHESIPAEALNNPKTDKTRYKHLRLKPSNILFTKDWKVKVSDYGLGLPKYFAEPEKNKAHWFTNQQIHFTAPEILKDPTNPLFESDVWSFGLILLTLFNEKAYFSEAKNYEEVEALILKGLDEKDIQLSPKTTRSKTLNSLIKSCLSLDPAKRPSFSKIPHMVSETQSIWEIIVQETVSAGSKVKQDIWNAAVAKSDKKDAVLWSVLKPELLGKKVDPEVEQCTKFFFGVSKGDILSNTDVTLTSKTVLGFLSVVNPFEPKSFGQWCQNLVSKPWYFGTLERNDAESYLQEAVFANPKAKPFLVRNSERADYKFCFVHKVTQGQKEIWEHLALEPDWYKDKDPITYIEELANSRGLKPVKFDIDKRPQKTFLQNTVLLDSQTLAIRSFRNSSSTATWGTSSSLKGSKVIT